MNTVQSLRDGTARLISENPVTVTIHRTEYKEDGVGGRYTEERELASFAGRLVPSRQQQRQYQTEAGEIQLSSWILLAPYTADVRVRVGSNVEDVFIAGGQKYRVKQVVQRKYQGSVYAVHAALEEVS